MSKEDLKTGDILHCRGRKWLAKAIMKFTRGRWSHTAVVVECWGQIYIVDAQLNGVNARPYEEWVKEFNYEYKVSRPKFQIEPKDFSIRAFTKVGSTKYDVISLIWHQPLYIITGKWNGKTRDNATGRMYCSEYVGWLYNMPKWWELSPQDLYLNCLEPGYDFNLI